MSSHFSNYSDNFLLDFDDDIQFFCQFIIIFLITLLLSTSLEIRVILSDTFSRVVVLCAPKRFNEFY